jgi:hypothetical protein
METQEQTQHANIMAGRAIMEEYFAKRKKASGRKGTRGMRKFNKPAARLRNKRTRKARRKNRK